MLRPTDPTPQPASAETLPAHVLAQHANESELPIGEASGNDDDDDDDDQSPSPPPCPYSPVAGKPAVGFEAVAEKISYPGTFVVASPIHPQKLFVGEKRGTIRIVEPGQKQPSASVFLQLAVAQNELEMGLLGFAFHPQFPRDPRFYVNYNPPSRDKTIVAEYRVKRDNPYVVDRTVPPRLLLDVAQPFGNHNAGMLAFGPDGYLYVGFGDGGTLPPGAGKAVSQDPNHLLGKLLRIGVDPQGARPYTVPRDNPFVGRAGYRPEIWALGLRNPWRFDFDAKTGVLYLGDVGDARWEEINIITKGHNYGWDALEGFECFGGPCDATAKPNHVNKAGYTAPLVVLPHPRNLSVIGGYVYRGCEVPTWQGTYFYGDWINSDVYALRWDGTKLHDMGVVAKFPYATPTSFGTNAWGDIYVLTGNDPDGGFLWRMRPQP